MPKVVVQRCTRADIERLAGDVYPLATAQALADKNSFQNPAKNVWATGCRHELWVTSNDAGEGKKSPKSLGSLCGEGIFVAGQRRRQLPL